MNILPLLLIFISYGASCPPDFCPFSEHKCFLVEYKHKKSVTDAEKSCKLRGAMIGAHTELVYWAALKLLDKWTWSDGTILNYGSWWPRDNSSIHWGSKYASFTPGFHNIHFTTTAPEFQAFYACSTEVTKIHEDEEHGCPDKYEYVAQFRKCYRIASRHPSNSDFTMAASYCAKDGGQLIKIESFYENNYIHRKLIQHSHSYWIGYNKLNDASWTWVDNTSANYTNWSGDERKYECAKIKPIDGTWGTSECHHSRPFICEAPPSIFSVKYSKEVNFGITKANFVPSIEHYEIKEGDIRSLFGYLENKKLTVVLKETNASSIALKPVDRKWPGAQVPVVISDSFDWRWKHLIESAMREIQRKTCVRFREPKWNEKDYVYIKQVSINACDSIVGRQGGIQPLRLGPQCDTRKIVLHELMHALGFLHEHTRPDRDKYIKINWNLIDPHYKVQFEKQSSKDVTILNTPYSYDSIMHYEQNSFGLHEDDITIVPKRHTTNLTGGERLSPIDVIRINRYYCETDKSTCPKSDINLKKSTSACLMSSYYSTFVFLLTITFFVFLFESC